MSNEVFKLTRGFALTGSIGVGKSTVTDCLRRRGWTVLESDRLAREMVRPGEPCHGEIREAFGDEVFGPDDELDRGKLSEIIFGDPEKRRKLEAILHPRIRERWLAEAEQAEQQGAWVAVDVPLLYETGGEQHFHHVMVIACSAKTQRARLIKRGWRSKEIEKRIEAQMPQQEKMDRADSVIWNEFSKEEMEQQLQRILDTLQERPTYAEKEK
jgi:dephospho-CoA kinase